MRKPALAMVAVMAGLLLSTGAFIAPRVTHVLTDTRCRVAAQKPWNAGTLQSALTQALRARLTAGENGLRWQPRISGKLMWLELQGLQPLAFAVQGNVCVLVSDSETLSQSLVRGKGSKAPRQMATIAAGFNHTAERSRFVRITALLDLQSPSQQRPSDQDKMNSDDSPECGAPGCFSRNIRSLSDTFEALDSETFIERPDAKMGVVRQTVVYQWRH